MNKLPGDCDDSRADVHPGAPENCSDGIDNNCNGLIDQADPACGQLCAGGGSNCHDNFDCQLGMTFCAQSGGPAGCCTYCALPPIGCGPNEIPVSSGIDPQTGCPGVTCVANTICPGVAAPVCATNGATYNNECEAMRAQATVAHPGDCDPGEGLFCNPSDPTSCGPSGDMYCRDACPTCDAFDFQCMKKGACVLDYDCPAGEPPPTLVCMPGQTQHVACVNHACQYSCQ
jgi:hypothetical protein